MAVLLMLGWWYSRGWLWIIDVTEARLHAIARAFAIKILIKTLFSPWKQIYTQKNFQNFIQVSIDNGISRCIGFVVRGSMLLWALVLSTLVVLIGVLSFIAWPFIPMLTLILPILTLTGAGL